MFGDSKIKKYKKQMSKLYSKNEQLNDMLYELMDKSECSNCEQYNRGKVKKQTERFVNCDVCKHSKKLIEIAAEIDANYDEQAKLRNGEYASAIWEYYSKKKPRLVRQKDKTISEWDDVFKDSFEKLGEADKSMLIGLIEGDSKYVLK